MNRTTFSRQVSRFSVALLASLLCLASSRLLYELLSPQWRWLGQSWAVFPAALAAAGAGWWWSGSRFQSRDWGSSSLFWPLALNLLYLFDPAVDLGRSRFVFLASIWLIGLLMTERRNRRKSWSWPASLLIIAALLPVYLATMPATVGRADTFEFQVVAPQLGIAHPTGYPLYLLLGKLFTLLPLGTVAWRLNLGSVVYALLATTLVYLIAYRLLKRPLPAITSAIVLGLTPTFWSQAIEAEVYALHLLFVSLTLFLLARIDDQKSWSEQKPWFAVLALALGFSLTNHLTALFLLLPAALMFLFKYLEFRPSLADQTRRLARLLPPFLLPLTLYAYLPIRWQAVNQEPMGFGRFLDWVIGGRFQGALRWDAWLTDFTRYEIVSRLFLENWSMLNLLIALGGFVYLSYRQRRMAMVLLVTWLGYTFYALNYYVPDLAVFLLPSQMIVAIGWAAGLAALSAALADGERLSLIQRWLRLEPTTTSNLLLLALVAPLIAATASRWRQLDRGQEQGLMEWGRGVLAMPLDDQAVILADSEKIAPLYYLQQAEGMRSDLTIMVLPDEAAYRAELETRLAGGQTVYLARFIPGLEGIYHLRAVGPLTEVSNEPIRVLPSGAKPAALSFQEIRLLGYELQPAAAVDASRTAITFFWQASVRPQEIRHVYVRWQPMPDLLAPTTLVGQHPANNYYPTVAWRPGEIVSDFHLLALPRDSRITTLKLEVGLAPPYATVDQIAWQPVATVDLPAEALNRPLAQPLRAQMDGLLINGTDFPAQIRPQSSLPVMISGYGTASAVRLSLRPLEEKTAWANHRWSGRSPAPLSQLNPFVHSLHLATDVANGHYQVIAQQAQSDALCSWLYYSQDGCQLGEVVISGVPLPSGATNFEDKVALLSIEIAETELQPGGQLHLDLTWQGLAPMSEDYTIFLQVLDSQDKIVGQVDAWPLQGTYPTSLWPAGDTIVDPHVIQLDEELPAGNYRLQIGWYLLGTLRRLNVLDPLGSPVDDKVLVERLVAP